MRNRRIEKLTPEVFDILDCLLKDNSNENFIVKNNKLKSEFCNYFIKYALSIRTIGLPQTVLFYEGSNEGKKIGEIIWKLIKKIDGNARENILIDYVSIEDRTLFLFRKKIINDILYACKLCVNAYYRSEDE